MNSEYQRLAAEASEVEGQIADLVARVELRSPSDHARFEQQNAALGRKLASVRHGMALIRAVNSAELRQREREFMKSLSKKYHSQGTRAKVIHLSEGVTATVLVTYYHRCKTPTAGQSGRRGLYPILLLLGISGHYTPQMRKHMAKAAALLGSYEEAAEMLAEQGLQISVNQLRSVTAGMGQMLRRMTQQGSLTVAGNASGRRIVVSLGDEETGIRPICNRLPV